MAQDGVFFKKAAELNKVFLNGLSGHSVLGFGFILRVNMVIYWIVVIIVLIFIYDFRDIYSSKKMPDAERPYRAFGYPFYLHST
jgi:APA family basic amino acid/polyamine antiporter